MKHNIKIHKIFKNVSFVNWVRVLHMGSPCFARHVLVPYLAGSIQSHAGEVCVGKERELSHPISVAGVPLWLSKSILCQSKQ